MKTCHARLLGLGLCLITTASHAQSTPPAPPGTLSEESRASISRAAKAYADSLPPILLEASEAICIPVVDEEVNFYVAVETVTEIMDLGKEVPSTLPNMPYAWAQIGREYIPPATPGNAGTYRDTDTYALLHAGVRAHGVCTLAWQITDIAAAGDPHDEAKRLYQWIDALADFTVTVQSRDGARWENTRKGVFLAMTSNDDDVIFLHYGRL